MFNIFIRYIIADILFRFVLECRERISRTSCWIAQGCDWYVFTFNIYGSLFRSDKVKIHFFNLFFFFNFTFKGSVKLVVRYTPKVLEEMEARFEKQRIGRRNIK